MDLLFLFVQLPIYAIFALVFVVLGIPFIVSHLKKSPQKKTIAFVHLDLGVGGAERLVVDAATAIQSKGYKVLIVTCNHPLDHCFPETKTLLNVEVHGNFLPAKIAGRFHILCSVIRMWYVSWKLVVSNEPMETIFCDGVSACIPILKCSPSKVIFYCHFPDQLLVRKQSFLRKLYRMPMNYLEEVTTGMADRILVNSKFTLKTFSKTFTSIRETPTIVYPCVNVQSFDDLLKNRASLKIPTDRTIFLSINRFDPNKRIEIAIEAFAKVYSHYTAQKKLQLVIAGGYDSKVADNINYLNELQQLAKKLNLRYETLFKDNRDKWSDAPLVFLPDVSEQQKIDVMKACHALLYTPSREHFGIVPVEAMLARRAVVAVRSGGLKESITEDGLNGILCKPATGEVFASAMESLLKDSTLARDMGEHGRERAVNNFSWEVFGTRLGEIILKLQKNKRA